ncbi:MAG TPA: glycosyltransferase, partial [Dehalococcoidia bacterium]
MAERRIAFLSMHTSPLARLGGREAGGMNVYVRELARRLAAAGFPVDVFTRRTDPAQPETVALAPGARVVHVAAGPAEPLEKGALPPYAAAFAEGVAAWAEGHGLAYAAVHSHYWISGLAGRSLARRWDVPHVVMFHTLGEVKNRARATEHEPNSRIRAEALLAAEADRIVCAHADERDLLARYYGADPARVAVAPLGVDLGRFRPLDRPAARRALGLPAGGRVVLFVGRIEPLKGIDVLLHAVARLEDREEVTTLVVGGDERSEPELHHLRELARALEIAPRVRFEGPVEHERLPRYYNAADVCVVPSYYESFGLVAVEAMACGTPVVASRVG